MKKIKLTCGLLTVVFALTACKNYYNDSIDWMDNIELGASLEDVKHNQPEFITVDWDNPDTLDNQVRYWVTEIKGNKDVLAMSHLLVFIDNKFAGRQTHK